MQACFFLSLLEKHWHIKEWTRMSRLKENLFVCVCGGGVLLSGCNSMASSLYSLSLINTYSEDAFHSARGDESWEAA